MTDFYVRKYDIKFPTMYSECESYSRVLRYTPFFNNGNLLNGKIHLDQNLFSTFQSENVDAYGYPGPRFYVPLWQGHHSLGTISSPVKNSYGDEGYAKYVFNPDSNINWLNGDIAYSDVYPLHNLDISQSGWENRGWTPSNLTTFKNEICTYIKNIVSYHGYDYDYDQYSGIHLYQYDFGAYISINMSLFEITFDDDPSSGRKYYDFVFFHGNDPMRSEIITV